MNCYMYVLDKMRNQDGSHIYKTNDFAYPLSRNRDGTYKIQSGEKIRVCMMGSIIILTFFVTSVMMYLAAKKEEFKKLFE